MQANTECKSIYVGPSPVRLFVVAGIGGKMITIMIMVGSQGFFFLSMHWAARRNTPHTLKVKTELALSMFLIG